MEELLKDVLQSIEIDTTVERTTEAIDAVEADRKNVLEVFDKLDNVTQKADEEKFDRFKVYVQNVNHRRLEYKGQMKELMGAPESEAPEITPVATSELNTLKDKAARFDKSRDNQRAAAKRSVAKKKASLHKVG